MPNTAGKVFVAGILAVAAETGHAAVQCEQNGTPGVAIYITDKANMKLSVREHAIYVANRAFRNVGVHLNWYRGPLTPARKAAGCPYDEIIELEVDPDSVETFNRDVMAYALPRGTSGTRIHIFYDRVSANSKVENLLGYVLAHEIGHVLEGVPRHASEGILKAKWNGRDFCSMSVFALRFTAEDVQMIAARALAWPHPPAGTIGSSVHGRDLVSCVFR